MSQLTADIQQNYALFIQQAQDNQQVWALQFDDEWVVCDSSEQAGRITSYNVCYTKLLRCSRWRTLRMYNL